MCADAHNLLELLRRDRPILIGVGQVKRAAHIVIREHQAPRANARKLHLSHLLRVSALRRGGRAKLLGLPRLGLIGDGLARGRNLVGVAKEDAR